MDTHTYTHIIDRILASIELVKKENLVLSYACKKEDGFEIAFKDDRWIIAESIDPLSCILYVEKPVPILTVDDNVCISTLIKKLEVSGGWIRSFQDGWRQKHNSNTSINGWFIGHQLRRRFE